MNDIRVLPSNPEAEKTILGAVLLNNRCLEEARQLLRHDHFFHDGHRKIYAAMCELSDADQAIDIVTLAESLGQSRNLNACGGVAYLSSLMDGVPHFPSIEGYVRIVKDKSLLRSLIDASQNALEAAYATSEDAMVVLGQYEAAVRQIASERFQRIPSIAEIGKSFLDDLDRLRRTEPGKCLGLTYGIEELDKATTGIREAEYVIIGGRPGQGKSALLRQIAIANAQQGVPVMLFSPEMTGEQQVSLMAASLSGVEFKKIRDPRRLDLSEMRSVTDSVDHLMNFNLAIDATTSIHISELVSKAKVAIGDGVKLILVDYVQLVAGDGRDRRGKVDDVSLRLRDLAKSTKIPVVTASQLARPSEKNPNAIPTLLDLKESGDLEAHAVTVHFVYRPVNPDDKTVYTHEDMILTQKCRFGHSGTWAAVVFAGDSVSFLPRNMYR